MPEKPAQQITAAVSVRFLVEWSDAGKSAQLVSGDAKLRDAGVTNRRNKVTRWRICSLPAIRLPTDKRVMGRLNETFDQHAPTSAMDGAGYDLRVWHRIRSPTSPAEVSQAIAWLRL